MKTNRTQRSRFTCILANAGGLVVVATLAAACVSTTPPEGASDPSFANAQSGPAPTTSPALDREPAPLAVPAPNGHTTPPSTAPQADHADAHDPHGHADGKHVQMYTCPMHPEVRQAEHGRCPKCGMALELEEAKPEHQ